ncbi:MAG TPA: hypothetical protein VFQ61_37600 [Polyangiaceae bacterium]|nr:hypothetical protein [Polyangiaceae bacterium]
MLSVRISAGRMPSTQRAAESALKIAVLIGLASACGKKDAETGGYQQGQVQYNQQNPPGGYGGQGYAGYPAQGYGGVGGQANVPPGYGTAGVGGVGGAPSGIPGAGAPAGGVGGALPGTTGAKAQQLDPAAAAVVQPVINELSKQHIVAGSKPLGSVVAGSFQTGQTLEAQLQLQPQKCYSIVATALPPVTELNVQLVATTPLPNLSPVLATDSDTGPTAVIGRKPNCYKWPFPLAAPVKVVIQVAAGSGLAAAQIFEK